MYIPASVKCDICEKRHEGTGNGWFSVLVMGEQDPKLLTVCHFQEGFAQTHNAACGEECLHKLISQLLNQIQ